MERTQKAAVVPAAFSWSDLGAWDAIWDAFPKSEGDNAVSGDVTLIDCERVLARSTGPFVGVIGLSDIVVVAEPDAILVCHRDASQAVKTLVDGLKRDGRSIASGRDRGNAPRKVLTTTATTQVEQWILKAGESVDLPAGVVQVLDGEVQGLGLVTTLDTATRFQATIAAVLLVTSRL